MKRTVDSIFFFQIISFILIILAMGLINLICSGHYIGYIEEKSNIRHKETLTSIENSTKIEADLIDAVNLAIEHIETDPANYDCEAVAKFLGSVVRAKENRNTKEKITGG
jgi:hypothetical protein